MDWCIHSAPPDTDILSHSHVFPHNSNTPRNVVGVGSTSAVWAVERKLKPNFKSSINDHSDNCDDDEEEEFKGSEENDDDDKNEINNDEGND